MEASPGFPVFYTRGWVEHGEGHGAGVCIPAQTSCCDLGHVPVVRVSKDKAQGQVLPTALGWAGPLSHQAAQLPAWV